MPFYQPTSSPSSEDLHLSVSTCVPYSFFVDLILLSLLLSIAQGSVLSSELLKGVAHMHPSIGDDSDHWLRDAPKIPRIQSFLYEIMQRSPGSWASSEMLPSHLSDGNIKVGILGILPPPIPISPHSQQQSRTCQESHFRPSLMTFRPTLCSLLTTSWSRMKTRKRSTSYGKLLQAWDSGSASSAF